MEIRLTPAATAEQLSQIEQLYMEAFPREERKPFPLLIEKSREGTVDILSIESGNGPMIGEAILARDNELILLDYFAIVPQFRGNGAGSHALQSLLARYSGHKFMLEIESAFHPVPDLELRQRRKKFYLRNGMVCMDYTVSLFGIEMEVLTYGQGVSFQEYHALYENVFGRRIAGQIQLIQHLCSTGR